MDPWMLQSDGQPAHWLGATLDGKHFREPMNMIWIDHHATFTRDAISTIQAALKTAGFPARFGHSGGYQAIIDNKTFTQFPTQFFHAYSDRFFLSTNNHGRIFGPLPYNKAFYFVGSFNRESFHPFEKVKHPYVSFVQARDDLAQQLNQKTDYIIAGDVDMKNKCSESDSFTTGDHDGKAVVLIRKNPNFLDQSV